MTNKQYELKIDYKCGELVSTSAMIKAGFFIETEATKMLTAQLADAYATDKQASTKLWMKIKAAGYVIERTGNMSRPRVFEVTI